MDLSSRTVPSPRPRKGSRSGNLRELGIQLRSRIFCASRFRKYQMEGLRSLRCLLRGYVHSRLLHLPRDQPEAS